MENTLIEEFARNLIQRVRDPAIRSCDSRLQADSRSPIAQRWHAAVGNASGLNVLSMAIPDIVDEVIFQLLLAIDQEQLKLSYQASNGATIELGSDGLGELSGWFVGSGGWRSMYASERFIDDVGDLT